IRLEAAQEARGATTATAAAVRHPRTLDRPAATAAPAIAVPRTPAAAIPAAAPVTTNRCTDIQADCPVCGGEGGSPCTAIECCGMPALDGSCCGQGKAVARLEQCEWCGGSGKMSVHEADLLKATTALLGEIQRLRKEV